MTKQTTKTLRREGYLIANIYGKGLEKILLQHSKEMNLLNSENKETLAFDVKAGKCFQSCSTRISKCPLTSELLHVDLMVAQLVLRTGYKIPVKTTGNSKGLKIKVY